MIAERRDTGHRRAEAVDRDQRVAEAEQDRAHDRRRRARVVAHRAAARHIMAPMASM
jgi:hypothetical protein